MIQGAFQKLKGRRIMPALHLKGRFLLSLKDYGAAPSSSFVGEVIRRLTALLPGPGLKGHYQA